jgi:hypothetical protein
MKTLLPHVTVFVGGISDATAMLGIEHTGDLHALARQITAEFPNLTHAAFTLRDGSTSAAQCFSGALYEAATDTLHTAPGYTITQIIDRLGAGDAFTAGLVFSFLQNSTAPAAVAFAAAAGCLAHSIEGDYNYSTRRDRSRHARRRRRPSEPLISSCPLPHLNLPTAGPSNPGSPALANPITPTSKPRSSRCRCAEDAGGGSRQRNELKSSA